MTECIVGFLDVYPGVAYCHGCKLACIKPNSNVCIHCSSGSWIWFPFFSNFQCFSYSKSVAHGVQHKSHNRSAPRWIMMNKSRLKKKTYLGSVYPTRKYVLRVCFESPFTWCFTRMISTPKYKCPRPFRRSAPNISSKKKEKKKLSAPGDGHRWQVVVVFVDNVVPLKIIPSKCTWANNSQQWNRKDE